MNTRAPPSLPEVQGPFPLHHLCILARCAGGSACCAGGAGAVRRGRHALCPLAAQGAGKNNSMPVTPERLGELKPLRYNYFGNRII